MTDQNPGQPTSDDPREVLLDKMRSMYKQQPGWNETATRQRIGRMSDEQVHAALAMSDEEIRAARDAAQNEPQWAPPTAGHDSPRLWHR